MNDSGDRVDTAHVKEGWSGRAAAWPRVVAGACLACAGCVGPTAKLLDNSLRCVDISDLKGPLPLELDNSRQDSQVLVNAGKPGEGWHYGSPCVVWNAEKNLWVMYVHFQSNPYAKIEGWDLGGRRSVP